MEEGIIGRKSSIIEVIQTLRKEPGAPEKCVTAVFKVHVGKWQEKRLLGHSLGSRSTLDIRVLKAGVMSVMFPTDFLVLRTVLPLGKKKIKNISPMFNESECFPVGDGGFGSLAFPFRL